MPTDRCHEAEALEPRIVLAALGFTSYSEMFGWERPIWEMQAPAELTGWGQTGVSLGDVDGDGVPDFALGAPGVGGDGADLGTPGYVLAYSGATLQELYRVTDDFGGFGSALEAIADLNNDGVMDFLVSSPFWGQTDDADPAPDANQTGAVYAYSGAEGGLIWMARGVNAGDRFGEAISAMPDLTGDALQEVAVGAPGVDSEPVDSVVTEDVGAVYLLDAIGGARLRTLSDSQKLSFGAALDAAEFGGTVYVAVGAPETISNRFGEDRATGAVLVFSLEGSTPTLEQIFTPQDYYNDFRIGTSVVLAWSEESLVLVAGAPSFLDGQGAIYTARLIPHGTLSRVLEGEEGQAALGMSIVGLGDLNLDGVPDYFAPFERDGSQRDAAAFTIRYLSSVYFGARPLGGMNEPYRLNAYTDIASPTGIVFNAGDLNDDGVPDLVMLTKAGLRAISSIAVAYPGVEYDTTKATTRTSSDGRYIWSTLDTSTWRNEGFVITDGVFTPASRIAGLDGGTIVDINNEGTILAEPANDVPTVPEPAFLIIEGVARTFVELVQSINGPAIDVSELRAVAIGDGGHVLLQRPATGVGHLPQSWIYHQGVLSYLWDGWVSDVNASGEVVGTTLPAGGSIGVTVVWSSAEGAKAINGLFNASSINSDGHVPGITNQNDIAVWDGTQIVILTTSVSQAYNAQTRINDFGQVLITTSSTSYVYDEVLDLKALSSFVGASSSRTSLAIDNADRVHNQGGVGNTARRDLLIGRPGEQARIAQSPTGLYTISFNSTLNRTEYNFTAAGEGGGLFGYNRADANLGDFPATIWVDPKNRLTYAMFVDGSQNYLYREPVGGGDLVWVNTFRHSSHTGEEIIRSSITSLIGADGRVHVAGLSLDGDVIVISQDGTRDHRGEWVWESYNITEDDLAPAGKPTPEFVSPLVGYGVAWGGLNLAGVDAEGQVWTVWWSPGLPAWTVSNLSEIAGAPPVVGAVAPFVAPWNGVHLAGTDADGHVQVLWWSPPLGPGNWTTNDLTEITSGVTLQVDTLSSFVTPWNALNILGLSEDGEVWAYWWTPGTNEWVAEPVTAHLPDDVARPAGRLSSAAGVNGTQNIAGVSATGEVIRLFWYPGIEDGLWQQQNLTQLAAAR